MTCRFPFIRTLVLAGGALFLASLLHSQTEVSADEVTQESLKFTQAYSALEENYMDPLDPDRAIFDGGIRAGGAYIAFGAMCAGSRSRSAPQSRMTVGVFLGQ